MGRRKTLRDIIGIIKDKASLMKAALSYKRNTPNSLQVAVLRATTHDPSAPPPDRHVAAVLSQGLGSRPTASACIEALMDRLHNTHNASVALKCLITLHNTITKGSFILRDQLSFYPSAGGRNFLNLSRFRDHFDAETWELSSWVRWYAEVLEQNLIASRVLGTYLCSSLHTINKDVQAEKISGLVNSELLKEIDALVGMVEQISRAPDSLHYQRNDMVYEVVRLVGEDYRLIQHEIFLRVSELGDRMAGLSFVESAEFLSALKRLEDCRERLLLLFVNKNKNDTFWELISQTKMKLVRVKEEREERRLVVRLGRRDEVSESTRFGDRNSCFGPHQIVVDGWTWTAFL